MGRIFCSPGGFWARHSGWIQGSLGVSAFPGSHRLTQGTQLELNSRLCLSIHNVSSQWHLRTIIMIFFFFNWSSLLGKKTLFLSVPPKKGSAVRMLTHICISRGNWIISCRYPSMQHPMRHVFLVLSWVLEAPLASCDVNAAWLSWAISTPQRPSVLKSVGPRNLNESPFLRRFSYVTTKSLFKLIWSGSSAHIKQFCWFCSLSGRPADVGVNLIWKPLTKTTA